jgi:tetratricopeptide (TPR) repeat protein
MKWKLFFVLLLNSTAAAVSPPPSIWSYFATLFSSSSPSDGKHLSSIPSGSVNAATFDNDQDIHREENKYIIDSNDNNNQNENQNSDENVDPKSDVNANQMENIPEEKEEFFQQLEEIQTNSSSSSSLKSLNETDIDSMLQEVELLISQEKFADAINSLLTIIETNPTHQKTNSLLGYCFLTIDQSDVAENFLYTAIYESNFTDFQAIVNFIESLKFNEKYDLAISFLLHLKSFPEEIVEQLESDYYSLNYLIGTIYEYKKDFPMAQEWYLSAALTNPTNANGAAWLRASTILFPTEEKNLTLAESVLLQAIKANPLNSELLFNLGSLLHATNRILEAKVLYEETLRLNPNMTSALANLATILHTIGQLTDAKGYYEKAILLSTNNTILLVNYALCLSSLKFHSAAYEAIEQASVLDPNDLSIQTDKKKLDILLQNMKQTKENLLQNIHKLFANRNFDEIVNNLISYGEPLEDGAWWYYTMGIVQFFRKQFGNSIRSCNIANTLTNGQSILINSCLGLAYQSTGMYSNANEFFEQSYQLMNTNTTEEMPFFIFNVAENDIKFNLLQSYSINSQYDKCLTASCDMFQLPSVRNGGMVVLAFSYVQWSKSGEEKIDFYQKEQEQQEQETTMNLPKEQRKNKIQIHAGKLLSKEVTRIQGLPSDLLKATYHCLSSLNPEQHSEFFQLRNDAFLTLNHLANSPTDSLSPAENPDFGIAAGESDNVLEPMAADVQMESSQGTDFPNTSSSTPSSVNPRVILVSSFLFPSHVITSLDRQISVLLQDTLQTNLNNPLIDEILLINQIEYNFSKLTNSQKLKQFILPRRVRYSDLFRLANEAVSPDDLVIFTSCDVVFDSTLSSLKRNSIFHRNHKDLTNQTNAPASPGSSSHPTSNQTNLLLLALTSWSTISNSNIFTLSIRIDKQDVWILRPPIDSRIISLSDFTMGSRRSDNRLASIFFESGYRYVVFAPPFLFFSLISC